MKLSKKEIKELTANKKKLSKETLHQLDMRTKLIKIEDKIDEIILYLGLDSFDYAVRNKEKLSIKGYMVDTNKKP